MTRSDRAWDAPADFNDEQRRAWDEVVLELVRSDSLDPGDRALIESAAELMATSRDMRRFFALERSRVAKIEVPIDADDKTRSRIEQLKNGRGLLAETVRGITAHPMLSQWRETRREARQTLLRLPLSEASRKRMGLVETDSSDEDDLDIPLRRVK